MKQPGQSPSSTTTESPLVVGLSPQRRQPEPKSRPRRPRVVEYGLVAVMAGTLGIMAVPNLTPKVSNMDGLAKLTQLQYQVDYYRGALEDYRAEHHVWPGYGPGRAGAWLHGAPSGVNFKRQMVLWSDEWGNVGQPILGSRELGPYLELGLPKNPINGLESVRLLLESESFPEEADGTTGWYYKPSTGELRPNCKGTSVVSGEPFYSL